MKAYLTYFGYFAWLVILWYISVRRPEWVTKKERINDKTVTRYNWIFALIALAPLVYLAAKRGSNFGDTGMYRRGFQGSPSSFSEIPDFYNNLKKDKAYYVFAAVWHCILGDRPVVYFGILALIQGILITTTLRKYTPHLLTAFFIFVTSTDYLSYMQNGIRQFVAVAIIFAASRFIFEKKYMPAIVSVLIASRFHGSALVMIPVLFIVQRDPWNKTTVMLLGLAFISVLFVNQFTNILDNLLEETQYANVVSDWQSWNDNGTNPLRVAVYSVPAILSLIGLRFIREENDPIINVCVNMSVISSGLYLISMVTSGIFMGRLPIYVSLYSNCILLPWEIDHFFSNSSGRIIRLSMMILFLMFYYFQIHFTWGFI